MSEQELIDHKRRVRLVMSKDMLRFPCATEGCGERAVAFYESGGVGSYYCREHTDAILELAVRYAKPEELAPPDPDKVRNFYTVKGDGQ
jgi:hypothetical protein